VLFLETKNGKVKGDELYRVSKKSAIEIQQAVVRLAKRNKSIINGIYFLDDLTKEDFDLKKRARPLMAAAYKEGIKVTFRAGRLIINGTDTPIPT
jgi:hypothetical protein